MNNTRAEAIAITTTALNTTARTTQTSQTKAANHGGGELLIYCPELVSGGNAHHGLALGKIHWQSLGAAKEYKAEAALDSWQSGCLDELKQQIEAYGQGNKTPTKPQPLTLLLPSHCLLSGSLTLPKAQRRHLHKALPFLIEEFLADDVDQFHIAYQPRLQQDELEVYYQCINKQLLNELLGSFNGSHSQLKAIYSETQWLLAQQQGSEASSAQHRLWLLDPPEPLEQQWLVSQSTKGLNSEQSARLQRDALPTALEILMEHDSEIGIRCQAAAEMLSEAERSTLNTYPDTELQDCPAVCMPGTSTSAMAHARLAQQSDNNLLQGEYRPSRKTSSKSALWSALAAGLGIVFILQSGYWLASGWYFQQQQQQLARQTQALYLEYFPQDKRIVDVRRQTQSHLRQSSKSGGAFLPLLRHFANIWGELPASFSLQQLRYQGRDQLLITLEADSIASLDRLTRKLSHSGLKAKLLSAKEVEPNSTQAPATAARFEARFEASISLNRAQRLSQR